MKRKPPMRTVYSAAPSAILRAASERCSVRSRSLRTMHPQFWRWAPWCISARAKPRAEGLCFPWCQCWTTQIIDAAGDFLIQSREYADGLVLYRAALQRFPDVTVFHQGRGCCAGHMGELQEAVAASRHALELEPDDQQFVNDLGWSLTRAGYCRKRWRRLSASLSWTRLMSVRARIYAFAIGKSPSVEVKKPAQSRLLRACLRPPRGPA